MSDLPYLNPGNVRVTYLPCPCGHDSRRARWEWWKRHLRGFMPRPLRRFLPRWYYQEGEREEIQARVEELKALFVEVDDDETD